MLNAFIGLLLGFSLCILYEKIERGESIKLLGRIIFSKNHEIINGKLYTYFKIFKKQIWLFKEKETNNVK